MTIPQSGNPSIVTALHRSALRKMLALAAPLIDGAGGERSACAERLRSDEPTMRDLAWLLVDLDDEDIGPAREPWRELWAFVSAEQI